jgi:hypothetical protein
MSPGAALMMVSSPRRGAAGCTGTPVLGSSCGAWAGSQRRWWKRRARCRLRQRSAPFALALGFFSRQVGAGGRVVAGAGDGDDVQGVVELAVAAAVESVAVALPGGAGDRRRAGLAGETGVAWESLGAGGAADQQRRGQGTAAGLGEQPGTVRRDQGMQLALERIRPAGQHAQLRDLLARDPDAGARGQATQASIDASELPGSGQRAAAERALELRGRARADASAIGSARGCARRRGPCGDQRASGSPSPPDRGRRRGSAPRRP